MHACLGVAANCVDCVFSDHLHELQARSLDEFVDVFGVVSAGVCVRSRLHHCYLETPKQILERESRNFGENCQLRTKAEDKFERDDKGSKIGSKSNRNARSGKSMAHTRNTEAATPTVGGAALLPMFKV